VFNSATLVMVVSDKRTDIAILRTLGMSPRGVLAVFMTQGVLIGWIARHRRRAGLCVALNVPFLEQALDLHIMDRTCTTFRAFRAKPTPSMSSSSPFRHWVLTLVATIYPALQAARPTCRGIALRMNRYWYEGF